MKEKKKKTKNPSYTQTTVSQIKGVGDVEEGKVGINGDGGKLDLG